MKNVIMTITGPSASGKSTLEAMLVEVGFARALSTTTRKPREGEVNGEHYHFVSYNDFVHMVDRGQMVEKVEFAGNLYGLQAKDVDNCFEAGKPVIAVVEPNGMEQIRHYANENGWHHLSVFVTNKLATLIARFVNRDEDVPDEVLVERIQNLIINEVNWERQYDWDITVEHFDQENQEVVIDFLKAHVVAMQGGHALSSFG